MSSTAPTSAPRPRLALTPGEPAGIGPDLAIMLAGEPRDATVVHFADPALLAARAAALDLAVRIVEVDDVGAAAPAAPGTMLVRPVPTAAPVTAGRLDVRNARYVLACLDHAIAACADGRLDALVTGPLQKSVINDAGRPFSGHTEYLAERLGAPLPVMMLAAGNLRVVLVTTHVALRDVPALITAARVEAVLDIVHAELGSVFGLPQPRLCVCGLNPHAGEGGHLGREELDVIGPVLSRLRARGWHCDGPVPADTAFAPAQRARYDAIVAMYHDQGLAALKAVAFGDAVNITLGLPIVRTSVDHGTALDLAGSGRAAPDSLRAALELAAQLARHRHARR